MLPNRPPGHTCPGIDHARQQIQKLARARTAATHIEHEAEALAALERVRSENTEMRAVYVDAMAFRHIAIEAISLVHSGYDGALAGPEVEPLIRAITAYERRRKGAA